MTADQAAAGVKLEPGFWTVVDSFDNGRVVGLIPIRLSDTPQGVYRWEAEGLAWFRDDGESNHGCYRAGLPFTPFDADDLQVRVCALEEENALLRDRLAELATELGRLNKSLEPYRRKRERQVV